MAYYTHNTNPNYYKENCGFSNCGSYAFNIEEWYDADNGFEWEVGDIDSWVIEMAANYSDEEISEMYSKAVVEQIFDDFVPNTYINIQFVDGKYDGIYQFSMVDEDDEGIFMEYLDYFDYDTPTTDRKTQEYDGLYSDKHEI